MPVGVFRRGGRYSLRRRVPVDLVEHYGKAEIVKALGTSRITRRDVIEFKNKLREEGQTLRNIKVKLSRLRTLFGYAVANDFRADNPAQGVTVAIKDAEQTRRSYDPASLKQLFAGPVHSQDARPSGGRGEAAYWLPLLALYTGARLEELGQLRTQDVQFTAFAGENDREETAWFIHITRDDGDGLTLKNSGSQRMVPVHTTLEECGFLRFVQDRIAAGEKRIFPELKPDKYGRVTAKWGEWFSSYRRDTCGIADPRLVFHSFRHTFKDCARHVGMTEGVQRQIMGHSAADVAASYPTWAEAQRGGAVERGWIPTFVPESAREIRDSHDLDSNRQTLFFVAQPSDVEAMVVGFSSVSDANQAAVSDLSREHGLAPASDAYMVCARPLNGALLVDRESGRVVYTTDVEWADKECSQGQ